MNTFLRGVLTAVLIAAIGISGYCILSDQSGYADEAGIHREVLSYRPSEPETSATADSGKTENTINQSIVDLQAQYPDAVGWISVPYTAIDYPFVQGPDNTFYLDRDIGGKPAAAGAVFMDYRNNRDFSDFNTILYGHHMKNGSMFASLKQFNDPDFFSANRTGTLFLADKICSVEFFAYLVVGAEEDLLWGREPADQDTVRTFTEKIKKEARHYREPGLTTADRIVTLYSCAYEFDGARMVLMGKIY
ncbi:MAG: class B sortase [Oscillospiraceae bacterium]|nr:class B sortase [Oscillospiraceae bacterium]